jgi:hypothetical protein
MVVSTGKTREKRLRAITLNVTALCRKGHKLSSGFLRACVNRGAAYAMDQNGQSPPHTIKFLTYGGTDKANAAQSQLRYSEGFENHPSVLASRSPHLSSVESIQKLV